MKSPLLSELQEQFKHYLFSGELDFEMREAQLLPYITVRNNISAELRLEVYRNAYYIRLQEAIAHDFPAVLAVAGDEKFGQLITLYIQDNPSHTPSLRDFGEALPAWLTRQGEVVLADLAFLEWAVVTAFDASDVTPIQSDRLANIDPEHWVSLRLHFHPSFSLLSVECNAKDIWSAVRNKKTLPALHTAKKDHLVIWRAEKGPATQSLDSLDHLVLLLLQKGQSFGQCCLALSEKITLDQVPDVSARILALALNSGWVVGMSNDDEPQTKGDYISS